MSQIPEEEVLNVEDLYDSERLEINRVFSILQENIHTHRELGSFQREVRERFAEIGIEARCDIYESEHEDHLPPSERTKYPQITLLRKIERETEFDHERMGHEVRSDILGQNKQGNVQKTQVAPGWSQSGSGLIVPGS